MELIADTTFLIGLWRNQPWAVEFARRNSSKSLGIPWVVLGEFWNGAVRAGHDSGRVRKFLEIGIPLMDAGSVVEAYAGISCSLQEHGKHKAIGQNDIWIAALAKSLDLPLVTRNIRHFSDIEGLKLEVIG